MTDACWGLSYITDGTEDRIQLVIDYRNRLFSRLDTLLRCGVVSVITPALRTVGNIVTGDDEQTQRVIESGLLKNFPALLQHHKMSIQKEAAWTISNITAGEFHNYTPTCIHGRVSRIQFRFDRMRV